MNEQDRRNGFKPKGGEFRGGFRKTVNSVCLFRVYPKLTVMSKNNPLI